MKNEATGSSLEVDEAEGAFGPTLVVESCKLDEVLGLFSGGDIKRVDRNSMTHGFGAGLLSVIEFQKSVQREQVQEVLDSKA